jgi:hypothetical protein
MNSFTLPAKVYNFIKYLVLIVMPALTTLYVVVATQWNWDNITNVSVTMTAVTAFLGTIVGISAKNYNNSDERFDGDIVVTRTEAGNTQFSMELNKDPFVLAKQDSVLFRKVMADIPG